MPKLNILKMSLKIPPIILKKTWSTINSVIRKNKHNANIDIVEDNGSKVPHSDVPNSFVDYFTNIATNLTSQLPNSPMNPTVLK